MKLILALLAAAATSALAQGPPMPTNWPPSGTNTGPATIITNFVVRLTGTDSNHLYRVERASPELAGPWLPLQTFIGVTGGEYSFSVLTTNAAAFYRWKQEPGFIVWAMAGASGPGNPAVCPNSYVGYATFVPPPPEWGYTANTNDFTTFTMRDPVRTDTRVQVISRHGAVYCGTNSATFPVAAYGDNQFRASLFFPSNLPTNNSPLHLINFNP